MLVEFVVEIWKVLLGVCRMYKNMELGIFVVERVFEFDFYDLGFYVIFFNIYVLVGRKNDFVKVRKMMKENGLRKEFVCSWVEIENVVYMFFVNDDFYFQSEEIYEMWEVISVKIREIGYILDISQVFLFVDENEREVVLQYYSEKFVLVFVFLNILRGFVIRIKKNVRVCSDCYLVMKFVSKVIGREIIVRD